MKAYLTLLLITCALIASAAYAETITLGSMTCYPTQVCVNVPNNANAEISYISDATRYGRLLISINNDLYDSGEWVYPNLANFTLYDSFGKVLTGSISITVVKATKCVQSGRVCVFPTKVTLNGGKLITP